MSGACCRTAMLHFNIRLHPGVDYREGILQLDQCDAWI